MPNNPFEYLLPVEPSAFVGRIELANRVIGDLISARGSSYALVGGRRCGKSSFLRYVAHGLLADHAASSGHWLGLPLFFDFKEAGFESVDGFLAHLLNEIRIRCDADEWLPPEDDWPQKVKLDAPQFREMIEKNALSLSEFEQGLQYIFRCLDEVQPDACLILLLDEMDETVELAWSVDLQNRLRSLIYSGRVRNRVRLVLAGSHRFLDQVSAKGSPLLNVLEHQYLTTFDEAGLQELTDRTPDLPESVQHVVALQSGRHPYLAQYLLHHLWAENQGDVGGATVAQVGQIVHQFCHERLIDLDGWVRGVEKDGLLLYDRLVAFEEPISEDELRQGTAESELNVAKGLHALCYHGLVQHENWTHYQIGSHLFRDWFLAERERLLPQPEPQQQPESESEPEKEQIPTPADQPIKILYLSANPLETEDLRIAEEIRAIDQAMQLSAYRERYQILTHGAVQIDDLQPLLMRHSPHIVHFSGHGTESSELILQNAQSQRVIVPSQALSKLFHLLRDNIECVVLSACYSASQAQSIVAHIDVVIGMSDLVSNEVAKTFATAFYRALGYQRSYQDAFRLGIAEIDLHGLAEIEQPILLERSHSN
ncbi:MAG: CHAT domain-containing protein [Chloroflexota bacterium]